MIERVARAICISRNLDPDDCRLGYPGWRIKWILADAKAVIEAMREPTEGMLNCFVKEYQHEHKLIWQDMIDKALEE